MPGKINGVVEINGAPAARTVIAISADKLDPGDGSLDHIVMGSAISSAVDGSYEINSDYSGLSFVIALDEYGVEYKNNAVHQIGDRIHPITPNGHTYVCTAPGTSGATEPAWWVDEGGNTTGAVGTATFEAHIHYRPLAHGPVQPEIIGIAVPEILKFNNANLVAAYTMEDIAGANLIDASGNGKNAVVTGAVSTSGIIGSSLSFNGINAFVDIGDPTIIQTSERSASLWFKARSLPQGSGLIASVYNGASVEFALSFAAPGSLSSGSALMAGFFRNSNWYFVTDTVDITLNDWIHAVVVYAGVDFIIYKNGVEIARSTAPAFIPSDGAALRIGRRWDSAGTKEFFDGEIDQIRFFNKKLTPQEVTELYNEGVQN